MKKIGLLILVLPLIAVANLKRLSNFGFEPSAADENRVQIQGWEKISSSKGSSYGAYDRKAEGFPADGKVKDGMSIYTWDTKSEKSLAPKTVIITTAFTSPSEKDKNRAEIYIYDYDKTLQLEAVSYCQPGLKVCTSVNVKSCGQKNSTEGSPVLAHSRLLASHYIGIGSELSSGLADTFKNSNPQLGKTVCENYFKNALKTVKAKGSNSANGTTQPGRH